MAKIHNNGGVIGKTLDFNSSDAYTTGSSNKKNSGIWNLSAAVPEPPIPPDYTTFSSYSFSSLNEGTAYNFAVPITDAPPAGTTVTVTASGYTDGGFGASQFDTAVFNSSGELTFGFTFPADNTTEGNQTITFTLAATDSAGNATGSATNTTTLIDTSKTVAYEITSVSDSTPNEGNLVEVQFRVSNSTETLYWTTTAGSSDVNPVSGSSSWFSTTTVGNDTWYNHAVTIFIIADSLTEGNEQFTFYLRTGSTSGTIQDSINYTIQDTSKSLLYGVYAVSDSTPDEGTTPYVDFYVTNSAPTMYWSIDSGTSDFGTGSGSVNYYTTVSNYPSTNNTAYIYRVNLSVTADATTEGNENHTVRFRTTSTSGTIRASQVLTVQDTSIEPVDTSWTLQNVTYNGSPINFFYVGAQETAPSGIFFKPDGTKMYVIGSVGDDVNEYNLSSAWDVSTASYVQQKSIGSQETAPTGIFFKPDGTKMYVVGIVGDDVNEYNLSSAWNVSTASYVRNFSVQAQDGIPTDISFKPDGTKMYIVGSSGREVNEYNLSSAWNISTASYVQTFSIATQETGPGALFFKPDGTKMYITGSTGDDVNEYNLSSAWNISTASYVQNFSIAAQETSPQGIFFKPDGTKMYIVGSGSDTVFQYTVSTPWNVTTSNYIYPTNAYFRIADQELSPQGIFFKPDGTKMYVTGALGDDVNEYNLSSAWNISTASYLQTFSVNAQDTSPSALFFKPDGTKMYVVGSSGDDVNEYNLSSAWNVSTASYLQTFSVAAQDTIPLGIFFKPDGTKMYIVGSLGDIVNEYNLSSAWNVSTASYLQNFSIAAQETSPQGIFFKPDGTKMYVVGSSGDDVNEYNLGTAWNVSTASYVRNFSVEPQEFVPADIFFKPDGEKMYIIGSASDAVLEYDLV